jgi:Rrf2 family protein
MKISSQEEYGLRCLLRLAEAEESGQSLTIPEIAGAEGLSTAYVAKLLAVLRQGGLIDSVRGRAGGYRLAAHPAEVRLGQVLAVLGEPFFEEPSYCERHKGTETDGHCVHLGSCNLRSLWLTLETWMQRAFNLITLADLQQGGPHITDLLRQRLEEAVRETTAELIPLMTIGTKS